MADAAEFANDRMGVSEEIVTDTGAAVDGDEAVQHGVYADFGFFVDETIGANMRTRADASGFGDDCSWMNTRLVARWLIEELDSVCESEIGIRRAQGSNGREIRLALERDAVFNEYG